MDALRDIRKHIFVLSSSGKPIFSRYGDEQDQVTIFGFIQAVLSIAEDSGDNILALSGGQRRIVFFVRNSLIFVLISSTREPDCILMKQLEFLYSQILLVLTNKVHYILENNSAKDLRSLLGSDTPRLMLAACSEDISSSSVAFESVKGFPMEKNLRDEIISNLQLAINQSGAVVGMLLSGEALIAYCLSPDLPLILQVEDIVLLCHFVSNSSSLRSHEHNWVPICLPGFNSSAYLQAYICDLKVKSQDYALSLVLISTTQEASMFMSLRDGRQALETFLSTPSISEKLLDRFSASNYVDKYLAPSMCLHFAFKYHPGESCLPGASQSSFLIPSQFISTSFSFPADECCQERIWVQYQRLALCLRSGSSLQECTLSGLEDNPSQKRDMLETRSILSEFPSSDHSLAYAVLESGEVIVAIASLDAEFYCTFPGPLDALDACGMGNMLSRTLRQDVSQIFQMP